MEELKKYCLSMLYGGAVGDALGAPFEHRGNQLQLDEHQHVIIREGFTVFSRIQGQKIYPPGQVTDDTEMTIVLMRALIRELICARWAPVPVPAPRHTITYDRNIAISEYLEWGNSGCPFRGKNTRNHFSGVTTTAGYERRCARMAQERNNCLSNGHLMRCVPLTFVGLTPGVPNFINDAHLNDTHLDDAIRADCSLTNPALECVTAELWYVRLLRAFLFEHLLMYISRPIERLRRAQIITSLMNEIAPLSINVPIFRAAYDDAMNGRARNLSENKGLFAHAIYCTIFCLLHFDSMTEAYDWVIRDHPHSDTDTNAAIMGAAMAICIGIAGSASDASDDHNTYHDPVYEANLARVLQNPTQITATTRPDIYHPNLFAIYINQLFDQ